MRRWMAAVAELFAQVLLSFGHQRGKLRENGLEGTEYGIEYSPDDAASEINI